MNFEDYENIQGRKLGPMEWACDCRSPVYPGREQVLTKMYKTTVDSEGLCTLCEHYAVKVEVSVLTAGKQRPKGLKYKKAI